VALKGKHPNESAIVIPLDKTRHTLKIVKLGNSGTNIAIKL
jgi:hypothetical protein